MYSVRRLGLEQTEQLDGLARAAGALYSKTLVTFWRIVRRKGKWIKPSSMMRIHNSEQLHAHSSDAVVQSFFASLKSWRKRRKQGTDAKPPHRLKRFYKIQWKSSAIRLKNGSLVLSNGLGNAPVILPWKWAMPVLVEIGWDGFRYELRAIYQLDEPTKIESGKTVGVDLGEVHIAVAFDGENCTIVNGKHLRSVRRYQNKTKAVLQSKIDTKQKGSRRQKRLIRAKRKQLVRLDNQINDITHKQTTALISTLRNDGVQKVVIGDVRDIRIGLDKGHVCNQRLHQWSCGNTRWFITYKSQRAGMDVALQEESYTSQTCPACLAKHKPANRNFVCSCGFVYHRDGVGAINIRRKYLGEIPVVGVMASPTGIRYQLDSSRSSPLLRRERIPAL